MTDVVTLRRLASGAIVAEGGIEPYLAVIEGELFRYFKYIDGGKPAWALPRALAGKATSLRMTEVVNTLQGAGASVEHQDDFGDDFGGHGYNCGHHEVRSSSMTTSADPVPIDQALDEVRPDLGNYDVILVNSSGGKDSHAMLAHVTRLAEAAHAKDRVLVAHNDLGRVEWPGTVEAAAGQARHFGAEFVVVPTRQKGDLLSQIEFESGRFPSSNARFCTSDQKTAQTLKLLTELVKKANLRRPLRILYCLGLRAEESAHRKNDSQLKLLTSMSNGKRAVDRWLPIKSWSLEQVWQQIDAAGGPVHPAYIFGNERASCVECIFGSRADLLNGADRNRKLAAEYVGVEKRRRHTLTPTTSVTEVAAEVGITPDEIAAVGVPLPPRHLLGVLPRADRPAKAPREVHEALFDF